MKFKAGHIASLLNGTVQGDSDVEVDKLSKIEEGEKGSLTFLANPKYKPYIYSTQASICIVGNDFKPEEKLNTTLIKVEDPYDAFSTLLEHYNQIKLDKTGIEQPSTLSETAEIGKNIYIGAYVYVGDHVVIGDNVKIYPHTFIGDNVTIRNNVQIFPGSKIYSETKIGNYCTIHAQSVLGADGFGFNAGREGNYNKVPQIGNVIIEDYVDIGAATTIDRATLGSTIVRKGAKLDNQIQVAHNVEIGENTAIAAQTGIAGSSKIGKNCLIGGQVGIAGHIKIGNRVKVQAQTGVGRNVKDDEVIQGSPAIDYSDYNKAYVIFRNLPKLARTIHNLEKK
jgi:UDP-3-O-[3-hydroxymyristoyl] glucosamine N-acyltransferase